MLLLLVATSPGFGQAEVFGIIRDPSALPVAQAGIQLRDVISGARFAGRSDERGEYRFLGVPAGQYVLSVEREGFGNHTHSDITVRLADKIRVDVTLQLGQATESVHVSAEAPLSQSFHLDGSKVSKVPLDGRNFVPLIALSPGVALPAGSALPRINGSRPRTNEYLYDGISVLQPEPGQVAYFPLLDGIEELRLNVNAYSAEYGRSNGGAIMVSGKSGSNELHGTVFEFIRNEKWNARNYFAPAGPKSEFRRNQYGFAMGGPIQKNKTFFFTDWQGTRLGTAITRISTVPTVAQRQMIPASLVDPIAREVLRHYPQPTSPASANNFVRTSVERDRQDQFDSRIDRNFSANHRAFVRYTFFRDDDRPVAPLPDGSGAITSGVTGHAITRGDGLCAQYDWSLSAAALNQARFGFTRRDLKQRSLQSGGITVPGLPQNSFASVLPIFSVAGFQQIGPTSAANDDFTTSVTEYMDTFSMARRRHVIKFGLDIRREALDVLNPPNPTGAFAFTASGTGNSVASLLLGQVNAFTIDIQNQVLQERAHIGEFFVADDWKVSDRLSLSLGARYTLNFPSTEGRNQGAVFNLEKQVLDFPHTARELECCNFGPRAGLAYRIGRTAVVRSGYGMIWFEQTGITSPFTLPQFPFVQTVSQQSQDNIRPAFVLSSGPDVQVTPPNPNSGLGQGVLGADRHNGSGYSQQWNFTVQKTFGSAFQFEMGYLGSKNTRLGIPDANLNQLPAWYLSQGAALLAQVPNPYFGEIPRSSSLGGPQITAQQLLRRFPRFTNVVLFRNNVGNSTYNAIEAKIEKRWSYGLTFTAAYTFSKLIDDASSVFSQTIFTGPVLNNSGAADAYNRHLEKDLSNGDIPRVFSAGWVYRIPRWWKVSGWEIAGLVRVQSGDTVSVSQATNSNSNLGFAVQRPNRVGDPNSFANRSASEWFDVSAFNIAPQFTIGNSSRNPVRGPGLQQADLMLSKTFRLTERVKLEFRAEAFNLTNTPPLNDPNGSFGSAAFGSITSAGNPRDFEFAAKAHF
jgi:carboxypeptidase family protein